MEMIPVADVSEVAPQNKLLKHVNGKLGDARAHLETVTAGLESARKKKWATGPLKAAVKRANKEVVYLEKTSLAVGAGFLIMPPIPAEAFVIRISDKKRLPQAAEREMHYGRGSTLNDIQSDAPAAAEGRYVVPEVKLMVYTHERKLKTDVLQKYYIDKPTQFIEEMDFPAVMAKPRIMSRVDEAMAMKVFDELAIFPGRRTKRDPMIVGRITRPRAGTYDREQRYLHFLVAWLVREEEI